MIVDFLDARMPGFRGVVRGVDSETLKKLQERTPTVLPAAYAEFLRDMGEDSNVFTVFPECVWHASALLDCWPGDENVVYDRARFFKIALCAEENTAIPNDYFLDLHRSDGDDAPVVAFQDLSDDEGLEPTPPRFNPDDALQTGFGFRDWIGFQAFHFFEILRHPIIATTGIALDEADPLASWSSIRAVLDRLGLDQSPGKARPIASETSWYGVGKSVSIHTRLSLVASVRIGAVSKKALVHVMEILRENLDVLATTEIPRQPAPQALLPVREAP